MKIVYTISAETNYLINVDGDVRSTAAASEDQLYIDPTLEFDSLISAIETIDEIANSDPGAYVETRDCHGDLTCVTYVNFEVDQFIKNGGDYEYVACVYDQTTREFYSPKKSGKLF